MPIKIETIKTGKIDASKTKPLIVFITTLSREESSYIYDSAGHKVTLDKFYITDSSYSDLINPYTNNFKTLVSDFDKKMVMSQKIPDKLVSRLFLDSTFSSSNLKRPSLKEAALSKEPLTKILTKDNRDKYDFDPDLIPLLEEIENQKDLYCLLGRIL